MKIGLLIPKSDMFPRFGREFLHGLQDSFNAYDNDTNYLVEAIGNGGTSVVLEKAQKLIVQEDVDAIVGFCGKPFLDELMTLVESYEIPLIHLDFGGLVTESYKTSPFVVHHSLHIWQSCVAAGQFAIEHLGRSLGVISSYYDGGYALVDVITRSFVQEGGEVAMVHVNQMDYASQDLPALTALVNEKNPDVIFLNFSYKEASFMVDYIKSNDAYIDRKVIANKFVADYFRQNGVSGMEFYESSAFDLIDERMPVTDAEENYNEIGLLGYEAGLILSQTIEKINSHKILAGHIIDNGPRLLSINEFNCTESDLFVRKVQGGEKHFIPFDVPGYLSTHISELENLKQSGWHNPYLCT